ncbi:hypothetical protein [Actinoplanes sp. GCM10030250]|uniref:hypothetical protein n=1 Tax=Actinoplanes sp. GCM10030250 TaxID=3273376 RepID=UPI00360E1A9B
MVILLVATVGLMVAAALALWPAREAGKGRGDEFPPGGPAAVPEPSSLEGVLVRQLLKGDLSRPQYLREIERVAARDDERHPLKIPGDEHPGACA